MDKTFTIIVPVYNEEESLPAFFETMEQFLKVSPVPTRVLFIDDGSTDESPALLRQRCDTASHHGYLTLDRNYGLSTAIKAGIDNCSTSLVGYIDADLQTKPEDFLLYFQYFPEYDMVNGIRAKRKDSLIKKISSRFANSYRRLMINDGISDTCCPLKIIKTDCARQMPFFTGMHRFMPALVQLQGGRVMEIPVSHYPRLAGTSKYHLLNRLVGPFFDTLAFRWMRSRYISYGIADWSR
ncbi:glycosyltransferase family 2 protein [Desulfomarina sp.]